MTSNIKSSLNEIFEVEDESEKTTNIPAKTGPFVNFLQSGDEPETNQGLVFARETEGPEHDDFVFVRENLRELSDKGNRALENIVTVAQDSDNPRAYEVVATMIKTLADVNKDLLNIHKTKKESRILEGGKAPSVGGTTNIDQAIVFTGSPSDMIRQIRDKK